MYWTQSEAAELYEDEEWFVFVGQIRAFRHIDKKIRHRRIVRKKKRVNHWEIQDKIINKPHELKMRQLWHPHPEFEQIMKVDAFDFNDTSIPLKVRNGWHAPGYGKKQAAPEWRFSTMGDSIKTIIRVP